MICCESNARNLPECVGTAVGASGTDDFDVFASCNPNCVLEDPLDGRRVRESLPPVVGAPVVGHRQAIGEVLIR